MAIERVLAKLPEIAKAPKDATCYICLEGDGESKLMRGCACRGDSAGFVHLECLADFAGRKESEDANAARAWLICGNCKSVFVGAFELEMKRRFWRRHRSGPKETPYYDSVTALISFLENTGELEAVNHLYDEATKYEGSDPEVLLDLKLRRAKLAFKNGQGLRALELLRALLPEAEAYTENLDHCFNVMIFMANVLTGLGRDEEALETAETAAAFAQVNKLGPEHVFPMLAKKFCAMTYGNLGRLEECKSTFEAVLAIETRIFGRDHEGTQETRRLMRHFGLLPESTG